MDFVLVLIGIAAIVAIAIYFARKPSAPPDYGDQQPPRDATPEEIAEYWRNR